MLNNFIVEGFLPDNVNLTFDAAKKVSKASFYLKNPKKPGQCDSYNDFYVVVYGKLAETCAQYLSKGKRCTVIGKATTWFKKDDFGNKQTGVTVNASEVYWE